MNVPVIGNATLSDRIAHALSQEPEPWSAADIGALIAETKSEVHRLARDSETARRVSLDPRAHGEAIGNARVAVSAITFRIERLEVAVDHLQRAHKVTEKREQDAAYQARVEQATAERDALAQELAREYPILAGKLADLFARIKAFEANKPVGVDPVESAGRGLRPNGIHWLATGVVLPAFDPEAHARGQSLWPRPVHHAVPMPPALVELSAARAEYMRQAAEGAAASKQHEARSATRRLP